MKPFPERPFVLRVMLVFVSLLLGGCDSSDENSEPREFELMSTDLELDPFGTAPLSARLRFEAPEPGRVSVTVVGKGDDGIPISHDFRDKVTDVDVPVLGLYQNYVNTVEVSFQGESGQVYETSIQVATGPASLFTYDVEIIRNNLPENFAGVYTFSRMKQAFDAQGEIRWAYNGPVLDLYRKLPDGSMLLSGARDIVGYHSSSFMVVTMLGEIVEEYPVINFMHHDVRRLPWGNYLVAGNSSLIDFDTNGVPEEDIVLEIEAETGQVVRTWDFNLILDPSRLQMPIGNRPDDWLHINSAVYYEPDNSIYITALKQSVAAKVNYDTGELIWILGAHQEWPPELQDKLLNPVDADGNPVDADNTDFWPYALHAATPIADGNFTVYDNGAFRNWYAGNLGEVSYSRAAEYRIDEDNMTVELVWVYDADRQYFTGATGDVDYYPQTNRYLIGFAGPSDTATTPRMIEVDRDTGEVLFEAARDLGTGVLDYRVERFDLYEGL